MICPSGPQLIVTTLFCWRIFTGHYKEKLQLREAGFEPRIWTRDFTKMYPVNIRNEQNCFMLHIYT